GVADDLDHRHRLAGEILDLAEGGGGRYAAAFARSEYLLAAHGALDHVERRRGLVGGAGERLHGVGADLVDGGIDTGTLLHGFHESVTKRRADIDGADHGVAVEDGRGAGNIEHVEAGFDAADRLAGGEDLNHHLAAFGNVIAE